MVVLWCASCGALMGMREPLTDWSQEKGVCPICLRDDLVPPPPPGEGAKPEAPPEDPK